MTTFDPRNADMRAANQIANQIKAYLLTRDLRDLDPTRDLIDQVMASRCADTIVATIGYITGSQLTDTEAAYALGMPADDVRVMRRITGALPPVAQIRAQMAQAA